MKGYEPGDADWGVKLADVRGQTERKPEVETVIELWPAGDEFRAAGGKPERGLLFIGPPGTGKTMLSKGIATSFNSPIVTMPGSGFAQTFIGMDVIIVQSLLAKARQLARKWGDTCMVFIDEIDAVGCAARRSATAALQPIAGRLDPRPRSTGRGARCTPSGDLLLETQRWRDQSSPRAPEQRADAMPAGLANVRDRVNGFMFPGGMGGMGGGLALNQLLVQMDGVDEPPFMRKFFTNRFNTFLDATYFIPRKIGNMRASRASRRSRAPSRSTSSAPRTCRSTRSTRRSCARAAWAATSGSARPRRTTAPTSSSSTSAGSPTRPSSTAPSAATSSRA